MTENAKPGGQGRSLSVGGEFSENLLNAQTFGIEQDVCTMDQATNSVLVVGESDSMSACLRFLLEGKLIHQCRLSELDISCLRELAPRVVVFSSFKDKARTVGAIDMIRWFSQQITTIIFTGNEPHDEYRSLLNRMGVMVVPKPDTQKLLDVILQSLGSDDVSIR